MGTSNKQFAEYLQLIKKVTNWKIKDPSHSGIKEDVTNEVFLKLFKQGFFEKYDFHDEQEQKIITAYIKKTVWSCYMDQLKTLGFNRVLTKAEKEQTGNRYENISNEQVDGISDNDEALHVLETPDQYIYLKEAYQWVKKCYESLSSEIKDINRQQFFYAVFWQFDDYGLTIKKLASHLGYDSTNPTQELNRFVKKVSLCTSPHGITLDNPHEQVQFLHEQINNFEGEV